MDKTTKKTAEHDQKAQHNASMGAQSKTTQKTSTASVKSADKGCGSEKKGSCSTKTSQKSGCDTGKC